MWTKEKLNEALKDCEIPYAFIRFDSPQTSPYLIVRNSNSQNIHSDFEMLEKIDSFQLELYYRDPEDRRKFEDFLMNHFIWQRIVTDTFLGDEDLLESVYEI